MPWFAQLGIVIEKGTEADYKHSIQLEPIIPPFKWGPSRSRAGSREGIAIYRLLGEGCELA